MTARIRMQNWGKDHWSTLLYIETVVVDNKGRPDMARMRSHSQRVRRGWDLSRVSMPVFDKDYPTRTVVRDPNDWEAILDRPEVHDHDDWDCVDDAVAEGLVELHGTGLQPIVKLTDYGYAVAHALRKNGCDFRTLRIPERPVMCAHDTGASTGDCAART